MVVLSVLFFWILWVVVGRWIGIAARGRGLDGLLLGLLLGPFGWAAVFLLGDERCKCPHCGSVYKKGYAVCCACGKALADLRAGNDPGLACLLKDLQ